MDSPNEQRKNIPDPGFSGDDGSADPALTAALAAFAADPATEPALLAALRPARLMVPIVALLGEVEVDEHGHEHEKTSDMAVPVIQAADGRRALPAFTSLATMAAWRADARPAPAAAPQAALTAYSEQADTLLIDPAGPVAYQLTGARLRAVAENRDWLPPVEDPEVRAALGALLAAEPQVLGAELRPGQQTDVVLGLRLAEDAPVQELAQRLAGALAADELLRVRLARGLDLALLPATAAGSDFYQRGR
ncbi:SseB family protein [Kitasatospora viridis]|uniref:Type III secretion system (T3SS) SseB-like protein n=1 Tax=Kitasatospora viridis TaxID=281105 RepID=A0A561UNN6_9ACTN|nr:SseB family protein [Kitasatospora viridis]TWG00979.1 type III secretion system (T3SS) SseB-like protein [Kitasatospora viridis]